jgi:hypothetical protein
MSKGNTYENELLDLVLNNVNMALVGDATGLRGSTTPGSLFVSLHTADVTDTGVQNSFEATYTSYARVALPRASGSWVVTTGTAVNSTGINFPAATAGSNTITHFAVGVSGVGTGKVLYKGALTSSLAVSAGITPSFATGALSIAED